MCTALFQIPTPREQEVYDAERVEFRLDLAGLPSRRFHIVGVTHMEFSVFFGIFAAFIAWIIVLILMGGIYTVDQNERAIKTTFGRAPRLTVTTLDDPISANLNDEEKQRYKYPQVRVIMPGGPYFKLPMAESVQGLDRHADVEHGLRSRGQERDNGGTILEAVTKGPVEHWLDRTDPLPIQT